MIFNIPSSTSPDFTSLIYEAVRILDTGGVIAMPSDTIYGVFCRYNAANIKRLHEIKKRPLDKPFLLVFPEAYPLDEFVNTAAIDAEMTREIESLWPGKNTIILPKKKNLEYPPGDTIAIRKPSREASIFFYETLNRLNKPLLAPSLNFHGDQPLHKIEDMQRAFSGIVDAIFFNPEFVPGEASRIWDLTRKPFVRLR